ncbi:nucleoside phosphatase GDA1/CD39 [Nadsonia fulvescens var. elongata DSM 6958]|uniref:guanosine-diphosphatase n=1 Tax=Nadsonia fulvescens var. elongata DSM 6958 TaxID=857566 RepID=A0A1E3PT67_9ASCO|nr:nucleoside phosphatase GDA1/CD39 [Nadsonia fulvescens var. elongata DSM 6958]
MKSSLNARMVRFGLVASALIVLLFLFTRPRTSVTTISETSASSSTTCTRSFDGIKPVTQYAIMIDAGSTGSRVHVYTFNNCQAVPILLDEQFKMIKPGLSSFPDDPEKAAKSLDELLKLALDTVPDDLQKCTPVAVKATAGLRLLGELKSKLILDAVRKHLEEDFPFPVVPNDGISIMDGSDEGVYAWITANYLLGNIGSPEKTPTAAVFDLGGGSTQIVFEPNFEHPQKMSPGDHVYSLDFGGRHFELYQHSHLGYGLMEARKQVNNLVALNHYKSGLDFTSDKSSNLKLINPCISPSLSVKDVKVEFTDPETNAKQKFTVDMVGPNEGSALQCRQLTETILKKEAACLVEPCSFNGIHQPSLTKSYLREADIYIFSYFYDRTFPLGMPSSFSIDDLSDLNRQVCKGPGAWESFSAIEDAVKGIKAEPEFCLDLSFMLSVLHHGYEIPIHREVKIAKTIKGNELGWCLGASLPLLDQKSSGWTCKN